MIKNFTVTFSRQIYTLPTAIISENSILVSEINTVAEYYKDLKSRLRFQICSHTINISCCLEKNTSAHLECRLIICKPISWFVLFFLFEANVEINYLKKRDQNLPTNLSCSQVLSRLFSHNITLIWVTSTWSILMLEANSFTWNVQCRILPKDWVEMDNEEWSWMIWK